MKYAIPAGEFEALGFKEPIDTIKLAEYLQAGNVKEFSQHHLGENVVDVAVHSEERIVDIFNVDNDYLSKWSTAQKIEWINRWKEDLG